MGWHNNNRTHRQLQGFTLIELLVVVAIISLLAAILFPVFARARENARRASCMSNEKQMALGIMMYAQDYDERIMPKPAGTLPYFQVLLQPYVKSYQIFRCPSVTRYAGAPESATATTYGLAGDAYYDTCCDVIYSKMGTPLSYLTAPSRTFMITETAYSSPEADSYVKSGQGYPFVQFLNGNGTYWNPYRHLDGSNVAFADGHVKWIKYTGSKAKTMQNWIYRLSDQPS